MKRIGLIIFLLALFVGLLLVSACQGEEPKADSDSIARGGAIYDKWH